MCLLCSGILYNFVGWFFVISVESPTDSFPKIKNKSSSKGISNFKNVNKDVEYFIALEAAWGLVYEWNLGGLEWE